MALFAPLPIGFPQLDDVTAGLRAPVMEPRPADPRSLAERLRDAYSQGRDRNYSNLSPSQWRQLPYAYWEGGVKPLPEAEPKLVRRYWSEMLRQAVTSRPTLASRWLAPLWHVYVWSFNPNNRHFSRYANELVRHLSVALGPLADTLRQFQQRLNIFQPEHVAKRLAWALITHEGSASSWLDDMGLGQDFPSSTLGQLLFEVLLKMDPTLLRRETAIVKVLAWPTLAGMQPHLSALRVPFADALLLPWEEQRQQASSAIRNKLLETFTSPNSYGDPRWVGRAGYQWQGVAPSAVSVIKRWLAGRSLETFVDALKLTADETWEFREKFWMAYHRRGLIDDVWLVLGSVAHEKIGHQRLGTGFQHGVLVSDSPGRRSVLILQIGDLTFVEWSHNGALRAYLTEDPKTPKLYGSQYDREELSDSRSLWMHDETAENKNSHLFHHGSADGTWQRKARDFIRRRTGVHLPDSEIL